MTHSDFLTRKPSRRPLRLGLAAAALFAGGLVVGATGLAVAHGDGGGMMGGWHHHHHGPRIGMIQGFTRHALDNVGATTAQEDKIHDIIANAYTDLQKGGEQHGAMEQKMFELLKAPTLDRSAFDKLRADKVAAMDAKSKTIENALFDAASQLSPEQRAKLVKNVEDHMGHHDGEHDGWHHHGPDGHDGMDGPDGDHGHDGHGDHGDHG